jgi:hypothetical protein
MHDQSGKQCDQRLSDALADVLPDALADVLHGCTCRCAAWMHLQVCCMVHAARQSNIFKRDSAQQHNIEMAMCVRATESSSEVIETIPSIAVDQMYHITGFDPQNPKSSIKNKTKQHLRQP